jgi:hypothetical protein
VDSRWQRGRRREQYVLIAPRAVLAHPCDVFSNAVLAHNFCEAAPLIATDCFDQKLTKHVVQAPRSEGLERERLEEAVAIVRCFDHVSTHRMDSSQQAGPSRFLLFRTMAIRRGSAGRAK